MKAARSSSNWTKIELVSFLLILNICTSSVLGNLYNAQLIYNKARQARAVGAEHGVQYDTQIGNLRGKPGEGYSLQVGIGTPQQMVGQGPLFLTS